MDNRILPVRTAFRPEELDELRSLWQDLHPIKRIVLRAFHKHFEELVQAESSLLDNWWLRVRLTTDPQREAQQAEQEGVHDASE